MTASSSIERRPDACGIGLQLRAPSLISDNSLIEFATVCPRGSGRSRNSLARYTASKERRATAGSRIRFRAYGLLQPGSGKASREAFSSVAKCVLDVVPYGTCRAVSVVGAHSHPISRLHHPRFVECCLAHHAYVTCVSYAQTTDSPEEARGFCTDPKEQAGSSAGSSLDERERVLDTQIELAGVDVALHLL